MQYSDTLWDFIAIWTQPPHRTNLDPANYHLKKQFRWKVLSQYIRYQAKFCVNFKMRVVECAYIYNSCVFVLNNLEIWTHITICNSCRCVKLDVKTSIICITWHYSWYTTTRGTKHLQIWYYGHTKLYSNIPSLVDLPIIVKRNSTWRVEISITAINDHRKKNVSHDGQ